MEYEKSISIKTVKCFHSYYDYILVILYSYRLKSVSFKLQYRYADRDLGALRFIIALNNVICLVLDASKRFKLSFEYTLKNIYTINYNIFEIKLIILTSTMSNKRKTGMTTSQSQTSLESAASKKANTGQSTSTESTSNESLQGEVRKLIDLVRQLKADYKEVCEKCMKTQDTLDLTIERMDKLQKDFNDYKKTNDPAALSARIDSISTENANLKTSIAMDSAQVNQLKLIRRLKIWTSYNILIEMAKTKNESN